MMAIKHHPAAENLMSCSAGSMPDAFAAVMASHIVMCPQCRDDLTFLETVGAVLFETLNATPVTSSAPVLDLRADEQYRGEAELSATVGGDVPAPLAVVIGHHFDAVAWHAVNPALSEYLINLPSAQFAVPRSQLRLLKVAANQSLPQSARSGSELTLVVRGSCSDAAGQYYPGDIAEFSNASEHAPIAGADGCICLVATDSKPNFSGETAGPLQSMNGA